MITDKTESIQGIILGALVADAASVGFHWLYSQSRIREVEPETPEFRTPTPRDYDKVPGYFAHGSKKAGDFSQYGEQTMVMLRSLAANGGRYDKTCYENAFRDHFGYGGRYCGYIDHPTRETLDNILLAEKKALSRAEALPFQGEDKTKNRIINRIMDLVKQVNSEEELQLKAEEFIQKQDNTPESASFALQVFEELKPLRRFHGADDEQLPALSKLPALAALYAGDSALEGAGESAVRVTNNNDNAAGFGQFAVALMEAVIQNKDIQAALQPALKKADPSLTRLIEEALSLKDETPEEVTTRFGLSCQLAFGVPSLIHNAVTSASFCEAVRRNIYAGGDSCGRAILLGALMGAAHGIGGEKGIPEEWIEILTQKEEVMALIEQVTARG